MLAQGYQPAGVRKVLAILSSAYELQVDRGIVARNRCNTVHPPELGPSKQQALTEAQARKVVETAMGRPNARRWEVGMWQGLRQGKALGLRWSFMDIEVPVGEVGDMRVWRQLQRLPQEPVQAGPHQARRPVPHRKDGGLLFAEIKRSAGVALAAGADIAVVSRLLRRSSIQITADNYAEVPPELAAEVAAKVVALVPRKGRRGAAV
jgi:integrase